MKNVFETIVCCLGVGVLSLSAAGQLTEINVSVVHHTTGAAIPDLPVEAFSASLSADIAKTDANGTVRLEVLCDGSTDSIHVGVPKGLPHTGNGFSSAERRAWIPSIVEAMETYAVTSETVGCDGPLELVLYATGVERVCVHETDGSPVEGGYTGYVRRYGRVSSAFGSADGLCFDFVPTDISGYLFAVPHDDEDASLRWVDLSLEQPHVFAATDGDSPRFEVTVTSTLVTDPLPDIPQNLISDVTLVRDDLQFIGWARAWNVLEDGSRVPNDARRSQLHVPAGTYYVFPGSPAAYDLTGPLVERVLADGINVLAGAPFTTVTVGVQPVAVDLDINQSSDEIRNVLGR